MKTNSEANLNHYSKILITGASGLIGTEVLKKISPDCEIFVATRNISQIRTDANITYFPCDLAKTDCFDQIPDNIECILHLAQSEKFRDFPNSALEVFNINTYSTLKLLDYAVKAGTKKFVYASSGGIYGNSNVGFNENDPIINKKDLGFYLGSKLCSEVIAENYGSFFDVIILRFFFVYGQKQKKTMLIPRLVNNVRNDQEIILQGNDGIKINPIHVSDASDAVIASVNLKGSHKINIAGPDVLSLREISEIIGKKLNKKPILKTQEAEPKHLFADITKMRSLLCDPQIKFITGIEDLL